MCLTCGVELLERETAVAALAEAGEAAAGGAGRLVAISGEPGIGKTALVRRFAGDLAGGRVLFGTCDDLSIPRPLGPFRDLAGCVSDELEDALAGDAAADEIQDLLIAELERPPGPVVLVLEDVHWADDATLDSIAVLGRRIGALPAVVVITYRSGEAPPGHPLYGCSARCGRTTSCWSSSRRCRAPRSASSRATTATWSTRPPAATRST